MRCVALVSGGLDGCLAALLMRQQGIHVEALQFRTLFPCGRAGTTPLASYPDIPVTVQPFEADQVELIRYPRFGYGRGANPCVDCRIRMLRHAADFMQQVDAQFVVTGDVVGQRNTGQRRRDLETVTHHCGLGDRLLRPLSAKILAPTLPEREGWVDRSQLYGFFGRGRRGLHQLAATLGVPSVPAPGSGCALAEGPLTRRVFDLLRHKSAATLWDFQLLRVGRHFRFDPQCRVIVGRHHADNEQLRAFQQSAPTADCTLVTLDGLIGPLALLIGPPSDAALNFTRDVVRQYSKPAPR
jgi:tRNA-uridine 2-sulfurtransferase